MASVRRQMCLLGEPKYVNNDELFGVLVHPEGIEHV